MNEAAAAGAKERDPLADVERQGPISWALHSIRTRYSLATAVFLLLADLVARTLLSPIELSIGVVTSLIGAIAFVVIFYRTRKAR